MRWNGMTFQEMLDSILEKLNFKWRKGTSLLKWQRSLWNKQLHGEVEFWDQWLEDKKNKSFIFRVDPNTKIQDWLAVYLNKNLQVNRILDVGSGPLSNIGKICEFTILEIVCCDVLADQYHKLLMKHGIEAPCKIIRAEGESLTSVFRENEFDIVFSNNAIDHTYDAIKTIHEMLKVTKPGGFVIIQVSEKEGQRNLYRGLHQWDFYLDDASFKIQRRHMKPIDAGNIFSDLSQIVELTNVDLNPSGLKWDDPHIRIVFRKISNQSGIYMELNHP